MLDKFSIAGALDEIGALLALRDGDDSFKARAYRNGAHAVAGLSEDVGTLVEGSRLTEIKGIGRALAAMIEELYRTGHSKLLDELRADLPPGAAELARIPGLSLAKMRLLHAELGVGSVDELRAAAEAGRVRSVRGFGAKSEQKLLDAIRLSERASEHVLLVDAVRLGEWMLDALRSYPGVGRLDLAGEARRWKETVSTIDVVAGADPDPDSVIQQFLRSPLVAEVESRDETTCAVRLPEGGRASLTVVRPDEYWAALHAATGSAPHVEKVRAHARREGFILTDRGLERAGAPGKMLVLESEAHIYLHLGMQFVPPELREDEGEVEAALAGHLPEDLVRIEDVRGMVHCHTVYSDGKNSVLEMARAAEEMGMQYMTITDHSPTASYAGGLDLDRLRRQWDDIAAAQEEVKVKLLRGTESDILADGSLDYPDDVLERLDVIIASVHNRYKMDEDQMTRRIVRAMKQPVFKIWGHALGRLINRRPPFECRVEEILDVVAESRAAVEVNGDPNRLDMEPRWIREARRRGIRFVVSTDAHSVGGLKNLRFGIGTARRGWVRRGEVLNTLGADAFQEAVRPTA